MRRLTIVLVVAALAVSLSACGRKGRPIRPEGATFPRTYPEIKFPAPPAEETEAEQGPEQTR